MQLILLACLLADPACYAQNIFSFPAANYYVDQAHGSDSNSGTRSAPFQTIAHLQSVLSSGQVAALACGSSWREQLTLPGANTSVTSYGDCPISQRPLLDASNVINAGVWSKTGGFTNIYQAPVATDNAAGVAFLNVWENGTQFQMSASQAALDSAPGSYYVANNGSFTGTAQTLFINPIGSTNPGSDGNTYEYNSRSYGLFSSYSSIVSNIRTRRNFTNNGSFEVGQYSYVTNLEADEGTKHNALIHGGSTWIGLTFNNSYYNGSPKIALVLNDTFPTGQDAWIQNAVYTETFETTGQGFFGHTNTGGIFGLVTLVNCSTVGASSSIGGFASTGMLISGGTFNAGITVGGSTVSNILQNVTSGQIQIQYPGPVTINNVSVTGTFTNGAVSVFAANPSITIQNSTFSNSKAFDGAIYFQAGDAPTVFTLLGNTFLAPVQTNHTTGPGTSTLPIGAVIDNNTYHYPAASTWINYRGTSYDIHGSGWAAWQALGFDTHGTRVTP